jgi:diguanylate cyclase (GGDEF)-like protein
MKGQGLPMQKTGECVPAHIGWKAISRLTRTACKLLHACLPLACVLLAAPALANHTKGLRVSDKTGIRQGKPFLTARSVHQLSTQEAAKGYPVHLRAVVTYFDPWVDSRRPSLFVSDASGCIFISLSTVPAEGFHAGQLLDIIGISGAGDFAPIVDRAQASVVGESHLPDHAPRVSMADMLTGAEDGQLVEIEGVVNAVRASGGDGLHQAGKNTFLDIVLRDGNITATTVTEPGADYAGLVDAKILLRGNVGPLFNHARQMTGAHMVFPDLSTLTVEQAAPAHPYAAPVEQIGNLLRFTPATSLQHRVHIRGMVTLQWPGRLLCIQEIEHSLCAAITQTTRLDPGEVVDVIGFPIIGEFNPTLAQTTYQRTGERLPVSTRWISADQAMQGDPDSALVTIDGLLIGYDRGASDPTLVLSSGDFLFTALLPRSASASPMAALQEGSRLRLTGICLVQSAGSGKATGGGFSTAKSFRILLRSSADAVVLQKPSWWNAAHTLRVLAGALAITLIVLCRLVVLGGRIRRQTRMIRDSEERFRLLATRDGLTQLPNRNAILAALEASLQASMEQELLVCVAILDLDHFKRINDSLGHPAGDEVLQETALRLARAVRKTDVVGRYGGEEFLIVFRDADPRVGIERCEHVRSAICGEPVAWAAHRLAISCSIGISSTYGGSTSATVLIAQADHALYQAKARGRNRVECFGDPTELVRLEPPK